MGRTWVPPVQPTTTVCGNGSVGWSAAPRGVLVGGPAHHAGAGQVRVPGPTRPPGGVGVVKPQDAPVARDERQLAFPPTTVTLPARRGTIAGERYPDRTRVIEGSACSRPISRFVGCGGWTRRAHPPVSPPHGRGWIPRPPASTAGSTGSPARYGCLTRGGRTRTRSPTSGPASPSGWPSTRGWKR